MRRAAWFILCMPLSLAAQESGSFDADNYLQVEVIVFTNETDLNATNRTLVLPELLVETEPRRFPPDLLGIEGASLGQAADASPLEDDWARVEASLIALDEAQLSRGIRRILEQPDDSLEVDTEPFIAEQGQSDADHAGSAGAVQSGLEAPVAGEALSEAAESDSGVQDAAVPETPSLWERYRIWHGELVRNCYRQVDVAERRFEAARRALQRDPAHSVIMHGAWIQPIGTSANHVLLDGGVDAELGVLSLKRLAFVEAQISLWRPLAEGYAVLEESRPLRLGRNYYLDHPMMGVVLRVDRIRVPPEFQ